MVWSAVGLFGSSWTALSICLSSPTPMDMEFHCFAIYGHIHTHIVNRRRGSWELLQDLLMNLQSA
uniref:Secreted protein n=1 Tax=Triticum urartu TaxID=4572 RepID=A0A8R7QF56_TRIUA